jgi:hypothetical protein
VSLRHKRTRKWQSFQDDESKGREQKAIGRLDDVEEGTQTGHAMDIVMREISNSPGGQVAIENLSESICSEDYFE